MDKEVNAGIDSACPCAYIIPMSQKIDEILGPGGLFAGAVEGYEPRTSQVGMAHLIEEALRTGSHAMIEGGTGTGKTFGYLVPLVLSRKKCVISTGTKNLQEQIYLKDLPLLMRAGLKGIDAVMMKGRRNYLCLYRFNRVFSEKLFPAPDGVKSRLERWLASTRFADRSELPWMADGDPLWDELSASSEQCLGGDCPFLEDCFLGKLRARAAEAQIVIVNHHLLCADIRIRQGGYGEIIPRSQVILFDEAHSLDEIATSYFGDRLSSHQLLDLAADWRKADKNMEANRESVSAGHLAEMTSGVQNLLTLFTKLPEKGKIAGRLLESLEKGPAGEMARGLSGLIEAGKSACDEPELPLLAQRAAEYNNMLSEILSPHNRNHLLWYEKLARGVILHSSPLNVAEALQHSLYRKVETVVFTSATLTTGGNFNYIRSRLGVGDTLEAAYSSHFDFSAQALLYIPRDLPPPGSSSFSAALAPRILHILRRTKGRALVLFTSYNNLNYVHGFLSGRLPYTIYRQGDAPRTALLQAFREDLHSVLLATGSFWEGVDVPGEALSCLIIDKLPFASPSEPLISARIEAIQNQGGNPFIEYQVPSAIISLKQGLGRLIRRRTDKGILAILDVRLLTSRYGSLFLSSLPQMPLTHDTAEITEFISAAGGPSE
jgi:ATP-dependent DNA helicase DinG